MRRVTVAHGAEKMSELNEDDKTRPISPLAISRHNNNNCIYYIYNYKITFENVSFDWPKAVFL